MKWVIMLWRAVLCCPVRPCLHIKTMNYEHASNMFRLTRLRSSISLNLYVCRMSYDIKLPACQLVSNISLKICWLSEEYFLSLVNTLNESVKEMLRNSLLHTTSLECMGCWMSFPGHTQHKYKSCAFKVHSFFSIFLGFFFSTSVYPFF